MSESDLKLLQSKLNKLSAFSQKGLDELIVHEAQVAVDTMKSEVPIDTGRLQRNIHFQRNYPYVTITSSAIDPNGNYDYAPLIEEYGGRFKRGRHYFRDAMLKMQSRLLRSLEDGVAKIIKGTTGSTRQIGRTRTYSPPK